MGTSRVKPKHIYLVKYSFKLTHKRKVSKSEIGIINIDESVCHSCAESIWLSPSPVHVKFEFAAPKSVVPLSYFIKIKIDEVVKILAKIFQFLYLTNNVLSVFLNSNPEFTSHDQDCQENILSESLTRSLFESFNHANLFLN